MKNIKYANLIFNNPLAINLPFLLGWSLSNSKSLISLKIYIDDDAKENMINNKTVEKNDCRLNNLSPNIKPAKHRKFFTQWIGLKIDIKLFKNN